MLLDRIRQRWPSWPLQITLPLAGATDILIRRVLKAPSARPRSARWHVEAIDAETFATIVPIFLPAFRLRPLWASQELDWLLGRASEKEASGALHFVKICDEGGALAGCCVFHGKTGGIANVLHIFAHAPHWSTVLDHVIVAAEAMGCSGIAGQANRMLLEHLYRYPGLTFQYAGGTAIRSTRKEVMDAVRSSDVLIGGLAGDRWTRLSADRFGGKP